MDLRRWSNVALAVIVVADAAIAGFAWLNGEPGRILLTPVYAFLVWGLLREIDPDHDWTALAAAVFTGVWGLTGGVMTSGLAIAGLMMAARIVTSSTGRRPLTLDLVGASVLGVVIGFSVEGWAAGFAIAIALYLDDRFRSENRLPAIAAAAITALGTTLLATATGAFPERLPDIMEIVAAMAGVVALLLLGRDPAEPISQVDARHAAFMDKARLHVSRSLIGIFTFLIAILSGQEAEGLIVVIAALALTVISNEIELIRRRRL